MTDVHCTGHVDYNPKKTTDFGYELMIDNDGEIQLIDRGIERESTKVMYISKSDIEAMIDLIKEFENGCED